MNLLDLVPGGAWVKPAAVVLALVALEAPAAYLYVQRADLRSELSSLQKKYDADETSVGTLKSQLSASQADLGASQKAAKQSSDSVDLYRREADEAHSAAQAAIAQAANAKLNLMAVIANRNSQIAAPAAAKESCDAAIAELRSGR